MKRKPPFTSALLIVVLSVISIVIGINFKLRSDDELNKCTERVQGTIIDYDKGTDEDNDTVYYKIYTYYVDGIRYEHKGGSFTYSKPNIGDEIAILYNPSNPNQCYPESDSWILKVGYIVFIGFGLLLLIPFLTSFIGVPLLKLIIVSFAGMSIRNKNNTIINQAYQCPRCGFTVQPNMVFCPNCNNKLR